ncbi:type 4a pilus biogenesis protein PilO [Legionella cincinnatiensis]|uniref:Tfp pilus assembly protein PilO n=1 Tax=Legionella cincinnatiensis TaxID=28085 RepID=A0A378IMV3_9GAMM|nr:type 4a pilus biogenesis protein PilO [Legionella cincinnatiensis]KTC88516.1 Tfp pilus assembly protein PilO [Legionella cincinnatiensis]STX35995.1 Tfp pilus assembly protein PilO [Legionella cincinnatiensis]
MNSINLSELTLENVGKWPLVVKIGIFLGTSFLIIALGYWLIIQDNFTQFDTLKQQETTLKADFENKQHHLYNLPVYRTQLKTLANRFALMLTQLPEKNEMPGLLEEISKTGVASGLRFELFAPQPEVIHDFYIELPIKISVTGTYFQLVMFVSRVAEMRRIVTLHDFSIEGVSSKDHKVISEDELVMNITAKIYRYRV